MAKEMKVNFMSVELAIQRELAYRKKIASLFPQSEVDFTKELLPLEMPSSTTISSSSPSSTNLLGPSSISRVSNQCLFPNASSVKPSPALPDSGPCQIPHLNENESYQMPSSIASLKLSPMLSREPIPCPLPSLNMASIHSEIKGKASSSSFPSCFPNQHSLPAHISYDNTLYCKVCKVTCSGRFNYKQHVKGHKHKAKLQLLQLNRNGCGVNKHQQPVCNLCKIWCSDEACLEMHLNGQKHKAKLQELELGQRRNTSQPLWCELCGVPCMNEHAMRQHLVGKSHATCLLAKAEKKKAF